MWTFEQSTGHLVDATGKLVAIGYAGSGNGKNNPSMQNVQDVGPLPVGLYTINPPVNDKHTGPYSLPLTPAAANQMFGRSAFLIHGDAASHPGAASCGCIVMPLVARRQIWLGEHTLQVVAMIEAVPAAQAA